MDKVHSDNIVILPEVTEALRNHKPVVALESAVITHGLPRPINLETARDMEKIVRDNGAIPATIAMLDGKVHIGVVNDDLERLASLTDTRKISRRDFGYAIAKRLTGGTTVAGTMAAASLTGIRVFATGGIGGVHREAPYDVSADLLELGRSPMIVVCAGAKAILDLHATMEVLETNGVLVTGYQTKEFPAFYSRSSGIILDSWMDTPGEIASAAKSQWLLGFSSAILVVQPPPEDYDIPSREIEGVINEAVAEVIATGLHGPAVTPFLLERVKTLTQGRSMTTNIALLGNNARLAAEIACALEPPPGRII